MRWLAKGCGAQEAANWLVNDTNYPEANLPERLTTIAACHVPAATFATAPCIGVVAPETQCLGATDLEIGNDRRELSHWDPWFNNYFSIEFPTLRECLVGLMDGLRVCGADSLFGADMDTTLACLCPNGDGSDTYAAACEAWDLSSVAPYAFETKEIGLTKFEHILQQAFYGKSTKFSETFATDDDTTVLDEWDYTGIDRTKIFAHWVRGDLNCPEDANQAVQDTFPDANRIGDNEFNDGRTHFPFFLDLFGVEDSAYYALLADLVDPPLV